MKLRQLAQLLQALHHCNLVSTQIPAEQETHAHLQRNVGFKRDQRGLRRRASAPVHSQFGELLQIGQVVHVSDVVVLQKQMGEVGGEVEVANVCDLIVIQVEHSEVSALGEVALENRDER